MISTLRDHCVEGIVSIGIRVYNEKHLRSFRLNEVIFTITMQTAMNAINTSAVRFNKHRRIMLFNLSVHEAYELVNKKLFLHLKTL